MFVNENADLYRHLTFASVGGFFGAYAILCRSGILASAQTMNLLELVIDALYGRGFNVLEHFGAFLVYVIGTMLTVLLPHWWGLDGVWLSMPLSDSVSFFTACGMMWYLVIRLRKKHAAERAN